MLTAIAVVLRIFSNPLGNVFQKQLTSRGSHPLVVNFLTYFLLTLASLIIAAFVPWPELSGAFWLYAMLGGIAGALGNGFLVKALQKGDLSVLGPINSYKSVVGMLAGIILLGEIPNIWGLLGVALIIYGSYFVLDTPDERFSVALLKKSEIKFRLWALVLTGVEAVFVKKVILASSTTLAFISWCCFGAIFSFALLLIYRVDIRRKAWKAAYSEKAGLILLIVCIGTMQLTTNYVFAHMDVGYALSLFQLSAIVSVMLGHRIFKEKDIRKKLTGSAIMIIGSVVIILLKNH